MKKLLVFCFDFFNFSQMTIKIDKLKIFETIGFCALNQSGLIEYQLGFISYAHSGRSQLFFTCYYTSTE